MGQLAVEISGATVWTGRNRNEERSVQKICLVHADGNGFPSSVRIVLIPPDEENVVGIRRPKLFGIRIRVNR